jgi:hypothetical protein
VEYRKILRANGADVANLAVGEAAGGAARAPRS